MALSMQERTNKFVGFTKRVLQSSSEQTTIQGLIRVLGYGINWLESATSPTPIVGSVEGDFDQLCVDLAHDALTLVILRDPSQTYEGLLDKMIQLQDRKGRDYGEEHDGLRNLRRKGQFGVVTRMWDKLCRVESLTQPGKESAVLDESIEDTCLDLANYALLLVILREDERG